MAKESIDITLKCRCGTVEGLLKNITPGCGTRIVCYCDDCQAFAGRLGRDDTLDEYGGTDIFQIAPARVEISRGADQLRCLRLKPKGLLRWYTACCKTPVGNTVSGRLAFVGLIHSFMDHGDAPDRNLGPVLGYIQARFADQPPPSERFHRRIPLQILWKSAAKILSWQLRGWQRPSPFFTAGGTPVSPPYIVEEDGGH